VTTWVLADTHFRDNNCLKFRQFDTLGEMESTILSNCRRLIKKEDIVYLLGDIASSKEGLSVARSIKGRKRIAWGNHDVLPISLYREYFQDAEFRVWYKVGGVVLTHVPVHTQELEYEGPFPHSLPPRYNIHGHVHNFSIQDDRYFNASVDVNNWGPIRLNDILSRWNLPA
jgi:calcineurin-like phosphoesterase family protein